MKKHWTSCFNKQQRSEPETVSLQDALHRTLATTVSAKLDHPPFPQSAMDGFAISEPTDTLKFSIQGVTYAGDRLPPAMDSGQAYKVATGGPIPANSFAVVPIENAAVEGPSLSLTSTPDKGRWIRQQGMDIRQGEPLIRARTKLSAGCLSNLAQQGIQEVELSRLPLSGFLPLAMKSVILMCHVQITKYSTAIKLCSKPSFNKLKLDWVGVCMHLILPESSKSRSKTFRRIMILF